MQMKDPSERAPSRPPLEPTVEEARLRQQAIGVKLRQMFDEVVNEAIPNEFLDILRRADQKEIDVKTIGSGTKE